MVVKDIFPKVEYPNDRESIEHIIKEYDKDFENSYLPDKAKNSMWIIYIIILSASYNIFNNAEVSLFLRSIYCIPTVSFTLYLIFLSKKIKKDLKKNKKLHKKIDFLYIIFFYLFLSIVGFGIEIDDFTKWGNKEYYLSICSVLISSILIMIYSVKLSPKKFMNRYRDASVDYEKYNIVKTFILSMGPVAVMCIYIAKPYYFIVIFSYIIRIILPGVTLFRRFCYSQYDKIQELKKQIGYVEKEK